MDIKFADLLQNLGAEERHDDNEGDRKDNIAEEPVDTVRDAELRQRIVKYLRRAGTRSLIQEADHIPTNQELISMTTEQMEAWLDIAEAIIDTDRKRPISIAIVKKTMVVLEMAVRKMTNLQIVGSFEAFAAERTNVVMIEELLEQYTSKLGLTPVNRLLLGYVLSCYETIVKNGELTQDVRKSIVANVHTEPSTAAAAEHEPSDLDTEIDSPDFV